MSYLDQSPGDTPTADGVWERLSQVAVSGAEYDSPERLPHPKCLQGTRENLLEYTFGLLDDPEENKLVWVYGTAGVGKSAVAFTVAERMRGLEVKKGVNAEKRLAGTFFFSRKYSKRCTTGSFFATLGYQLASNFPSIKSDLNMAIRENPALLDPAKSLLHQIETLFLRPLRRLQARLRDCPPLVFVLDALDECTSEAEIAALIPLLGRALRDPSLPAIHILLTSRSEEHIHRAINEKDVRPVVYEIPVKISGEGVASLLSLDGEDVDSDIYKFLEHSFTDKRSRRSDFPQPTENELVQLASRAGRRFIVASTMMNFIDDGYSDPRDRLQLMLKLTSQLLPGTEVHRLYDLILSTCSKPDRARLHLAVVAALANPLPVSQISELLGQGQGKDVEITLVQLRSVMDIPTNPDLPVNIYHSSIRDYVLETSNCRLFEEQCATPSPHFILAHSSFCLMIRDIPKSAGLLDALLKLKTQSKAMESHAPQSLRDSLAFIVEPPTAMSVITALLWLRGNHSAPLYPWLETRDGRAWLRTVAGKNWLETRDGLHWLQTQAGLNWLITHDGKGWLLPLGGRNWLQSPNGREWLYLPSGRDWLNSQNGKDWLKSQNGRAWLESQKEHDDFLQSLKVSNSDDPPQNFQQASDDGNSLASTDDQPPPQGPDEEVQPQTQSKQVWLMTERGQEWLQTVGVLNFLQSQSAREWLKAEHGKSWLQTPAVLDWLQTRSGRVWLQSRSGRKWLETDTGREWLETDAGRKWLRSWWAQHWFSTQGVQEWLRKGGQKWLEIPDGRAWLSTERGVEWLHTESGREWLQTSGGREWLQTQSAREWLQTWSGRGWLQSQSAQEWLQTQSAREWLQTWSGREWLPSWSGQEWLQTQSGREWLQTQSAREWLQTQGARGWLQTQSARDWLRTPRGQAWQSTPAASLSVQMEDFFDTLEAINQFTITPELSLHPAFQVIQQFKSLPDFLILPAFLISTPKSRTSTLASDLDMEIIHVIDAFITFTNETRERSQSASGALMYACQNWVIHLSRAPTPWDKTLDHIFKVFWDHCLLSWLERQWCLKGLQSCLDMLSEGQKLATRNYKIDNLKPSTLC